MSKKKKKKKRARSMVCLEIGGFTYKKQKRGEK